MTSKKSICHEDNNNDSEHKLLTDDISGKDSRGCRLKAILAQGLVTGGVMLSSASCGMPVGYSAILLPQLKSDNGTMAIDDDTGSWIASIHSAATPLGSLLSGVFMDNCGRKLTLQIASLPVIVGWTMIAFSRSHIALLLGRLIAGISVGLTAAAGQVLIGEITEPTLRGVFSCVPFASYSFGILLVYILGSLLNWRTVAGLSLLLPVASTLAFFFLPESPVWLVRQGYPEAAKRALIWLRGENIGQAKVEVQHLINRSEEETSSRCKTSWRAFTEPQILKPFLIINVFNVVQILSGTYLIVFYAVDILSHVGDHKIDSFLAAVLTACVRFFFTILASILLGVLGRRTLALSSGIATAISALSLGTVLYFETSSGYMSASLTFLYVAANTVGFMILPGVMLGELLPARVRGLAGGVTFMLFNFLLFGTAKVFPFAKAQMGIHGVFWFFGGVSLVASVFLFLTLPETKGVTLSRIEDYFAEKNFLWVRRSEEWEGKARKRVSDKV